MTDSPDNDFIPDEPDFEQHLRNVLDDLRYGMVDIDEAFEAIMNHPGRTGPLTPIPDLGKGRRIEDGQEAPHP